MKKDYEKPIYEYEAEFKRLFDNAINDLNPYQINISLEFTAIVTTVIIQTNT